MKKLKNIAIMLLFALMANFIPTTIANAITSKFGINYVGFSENSDGSRKVFVNFNSETIENIKSVKVFTKVSSFTIPETNVNGTTFTLGTKEENSFVADLNEGDIKIFGKYEVDKIEVVLKDGAKKISFNSKYYTSLGENDKENGELVYYDTFSYEYQPLSIENSVMDKSTVKLGEAQDISFDVKSSRKGVEASKIYITFKKTDNENGTTQVVEAKKKEGTSYTASLTLINSLDTGYWSPSDIEFIDNYGRSYNASIYFGSYKVVSENTDITPPALEDITLNSNIYDASKDNDVYFTLKVSDDISGVDYAYVDLYNKETDSLKSFYAYSNSEDKNNFKADVYGLDKNGVYDVKGVEIRDKAGNYIRYVSSKYTENPNPKEIVKDFSSLSMEVSNVVKQEPFKAEVLEMKNNSKIVADGTKIDFTMKVKANKKFDGLNINFIGSKEKNKYFYGNIVTYDENGNLIENEDGIYTIKVQGYNEENLYLASGEYSTQSIYLYYYNESGNNENIVLYDKRNEWIPEDAKTYDFSELDFTCDNPDEDIVAPELLDISLDKGVATPGDTVEVTVKAKDDNSGFNSVNGWTRYPNVYYNSGYYSMRVEFDEYDKETDTFKGKLQIPSYLSTGVYTVSSIGINDGANNNCYYYWSDIENKPLLSKGTILVKKDVNEKLPPVISTNIEEGKVYKAPFTPIVSSDHGTVKMLLNDEEYKGEPISKLGDYHLYITATGVDGSVSTAKVSFKVITEINEETKPEDIIDQIIGSEEKVVSIEVKNEVLEVDKSIFEAIKGIDKTVSFTQEDGTVWSFNGNDIKDENLESIGNIKISVGNVAEEENQEPINNIDSKAKIIHFDYHGVLPGKASVKIKVDNPQDVIGKDLTFYYFNSETQKPEKIQGPLSVDNEGFVTVEIEHCSDYFLSEYDDLEDTPEPISLTVNKIEVNLIKGDSEQLEVTVTPEGTEVQYSSSDENVAKVSNTGVIEAVAKGEALITVKAGDVTKEIKVLVSEKEAEEEETKEPQVPEIPEKPELEAPEVPEKPLPEMPVEEPETPEEKPESPVVTEESKDIITIVNEENGNKRVVVSKIANIDEITTIVVPNGDNILVEVTDIEALKNGKGILEIKNHKATISIPFNVVDKNMITDGAKLIFSLSKESGGDLTKNIKGLKKVFIFDLAVVNGDNKTQVHKFSNGEVGVSLTLTDEELKGLDKNKLTVFYYNEATKEFEAIESKVDGNNAMFKTSHFSKFIIAEKAASNDEEQILPQTGSRISMNGTLVISLVIIGIGIAFIKRKKI